MLVTNAVKVGDVVVVKTLIGDEILGKLESTSATTVSLSKPFQLQVTMKSPSEAGLTFVPYVMGAEDINNVVLNNSALIISPFKARDDIARQYLQMTSGISLPPKSGLII